MTTILVAEDDPVISRGVQRSLRRAGFSVNAVGDGALALQAVRDAPPDLMLLDPLLPSVDGYKVAERFRAEDTQTPIIMLSSLDTERDKVRGLDLGADDYVTTPFSTEELLARVRAKLRRAHIDGAPPADRVIAAGDMVIEPASLRVSVAGHYIHLRLKEFQLLLWLAEHEGELASRERLSEQVWGYMYLPSSRTIDVHIRRLRQGVEDPSDFVFIQTVHGMGYRFEAIPKSSPLRT